MSAVDNQGKSRGLSARAEGKATSTFLFLCDKRGLLEKSWDSAWQRVPRDYC